MILSLLTVTILLASAPSDLPVLHHPDHRPALPDTVGFRAELLERGDARPEDRLAAQETVERWTRLHKAEEGGVKVALLQALYRECYQMARNRFGKLPPDALNVVGVLTADLEQAVAADPGNPTARALLGTVYARTGRPREAIDMLARARIALAVRQAACPQAEDPDQAALDAELIRLALIMQGYAYREVGELACAEACADQLLAERDGMAARVLKGLCLAGRGRTAEAIAYAVRMKPVEFRRLNPHSGGYVPLPSAVANEWIKSQALLTEGDPQSALHLLGDIDKRYFQRQIPFARDFWQDGALAAELLGSERTGTMYGMAGSTAFLQLLHPSEDSATDPIILGFPSRRTPLFVTGEGGFRGGSPFAYVVEQLRVMEESDDVHVRETARIRALDVCDGLIARNIRPDLVAAFRARVYLAAGQDEFAHQDLDYAHRRFTERGEVDPATSLLLGTLELSIGHDEIARGLLEESSSVMPEDALAWRGLGVALARSRRFDLAREAMDRALELDPESVEGWYNLGVMLHRMGRHQEALTALEKAWSLDQSDERVVGMLQVVATAQRTAQQGEAAP